MFPKNWLIPSLLAVMAAMPVHADPIPFTIGETDAGAAPSAEAPGLEGQDMSAPNKDQITRSEPLPDAITHAIELDGRDGIAFMSQNGRFILRGRIFDMWTGNVIDTMDDLDASRQTMDLAELGLKDEDVDPFRYGRGPREVSVFVDPLCPYCGQLFDEIRADPALADQYTFVLYVVPFLGDNSVRAVNALSCAEDREEAVLAMLDKDRAWMREHEVDAEGCDVQPILNRTILTQMIGVTGVPYIIGAEGGISRGMPQDLHTFLAAN